MFRSTYGRFNRKNYRNKYESKTSQRLCPYCGEQVVYNENERGGDVGFGDLGPWPRHHCQAFLNADRGSVYISGAGEKYIHWVRPSLDGWYQLDGLSEDISSLGYNGVYIIWYFDVFNIARTVKVGKGQLRACLEADRLDPEVQKYAEQRLYATWALVPSGHIDSISVSLSQKLQPFVGKQPSGDTGVFVGVPSKPKWH